MSQTALKMQSRHAALRDGLVREHGMEAKAASELASKLLRLPYCYWPGMVPPLTNTQRDNCT